MLPRAPPPGEARPQEAVGELPTVPAWANRVVHPVLAETMQHDGFEVEANEEAANEMRTDAETPFEADSDAAASSSHASDTATERGEKDHMFDDISISDGASEPETIDPAPTGELTLAAFCAPGLPWSRRLFLLTASMAVNVGLPFINGVFLGFGEIFARAFIAPWIGLAPPLLNYNPYSPSPADVPPLSTIPPGGLRSWAKGVQERSADEKDHA